MATALKAARHGRGWTKPVLIAQLREVGARAGVVVATPRSLRGMVARWENGYRQPALSYQQLLCQIYARSPAQLGFDSTTAGTGEGVGSELDALAALLYVAPLDTPTLATVAPAQARFYAECVLTDPQCPAAGELAAGYRQVWVEVPPWLDRGRARVADVVARTARGAPALGPGEVPSWLRAPRLHGCGLAARLFVTGPG